MTAEGRRIGFPADGEGRRGRRRTRHAARYLGRRSRRTRWRGARSEAASAFGSDELILERAIADARHIEIQVFADQHGNVIHLGERDCSIQRRHQKVIEESPSPAVTAALRERMGEAAVAAARAIDYVGAGTVEFLLDREGKFYFLEMNTRLQVEHPVTEAVTGLDLVAWQLRVAAGEKLPLSQHAGAGSAATRSRRGFTPKILTTDFLPQSGTLIDWRPASGADVRVDHGLASGQRVTPFYDPMLAKVVAHGATREEARRRLIAALARYRCPRADHQSQLPRGNAPAPGIRCRRGDHGFHRAVLSGGQRRDAASAAGPAHARAGGRPPVHDARERDRDAAGAPPNWSSTGSAVWPLRLAVGDVQHSASITAVGTDRYSVALGKDMVEVSIEEHGDGAVRFTAMGVQQTARFASQDGVLHLDLNGVTITAARDHAGR